MKSEAKKSALTIKMAILALSIVAEVQAALSGRRGLPFSEQDRG